ncbi:MAG: TetR/AcrR family transcriptional regulator [Chthoniobacterales bacterium]
MADATKSTAFSPSRLSRRRIVETARAHFFQHGFRNVTMDDLAAELRASKKTLSSMRSCAISWNLSARPCRGRGITKRNFPRRCALSSAACRMNWMS